MDNKLEISSHLNLVKSKTENRANKKANVIKLKKIMEKLVKEKEEIEKKNIKRINYDTESEWNSTPIEKEEEKKTKKLYKKKKKMMKTKTFFKK